MKETTETYTLLFGDTHSLMVTIEASRALTTRSCTGRDTQLGKEYIQSPFANKGNAHRILLGAVRLTEGGTRCKLFVDSSAKGGCGSGGGRG